MFEKIRKMKNQKGFTLVELIVVLVILAILAAMLVPALTGYIDRAKNQAIIAETRQVVMATQTLVDEAYAKKDVGGEVKVGPKPAAGAATTAPDVTYDAIAELAEVPVGNITSVTITGHKITSIVYTKSGKACTYTADGSKYEVAK